jgi:hypothetical protein
MERVEHLRSEPRVAGLVEEHLVAAE